MTPTVLLRDAVVLLGRFPGLAGASLAVEPGEIVVLRGPNGAGKTTLLRACAGLARVTSGTCEVLGADLVADPGAVRHRVGFAGAGSGLYGDLTVAENLSFWSRASGVAGASSDEALELLGLSGRLRDVQVSRLSTGQRKRALLAVLVARRPELWLLDEPHAGLDEAGRDLVDDVLRRATAAGATVVAASHELERIEHLAHRSVVVDGGAVTDGPGVTGVV